jgi:hypothetical protein
MKFCFTYTLERNNYLRTSKLSNYKYLYGDSEFLIPALYGQAELRFCHIDYYAGLENKLMRDDESEKKFTSPDGTVSITHKGKTTRVTNFETRRTTPECYCLCLSNTKNSRVLFERFKADICLEVDVNRLVELMTETANSMRELDTCQVLSSDAIYYNGQSEIPWNMDSAPFYKNKDFKIEDEYRIAVIPVCDHFYARLGKQIDSMKSNNDGKSLRGINLGDEYRFRYLKKGIIGECVYSFARYNKFLGIVKFSIL